MQRNYAEHIEMRMKNIGMRVDILFPNPEIPLNKILSNIASRSVTFAVLVTPLNEEHRSVTVNILRGQQAEHRNMPIEDAMSLLAKQFEAIVKPEPTPGTGGASGPDNGIPQDIRTVLGFLNDNRPLSVMEYDKLIKFLAGKREGMLRSEYGDHIPEHLKTPPIGPPVDPAVRAMEEELKTKIVGILNEPKEAPKPQANPSAPPPAINPSLQMAIDSLIKTGPNLLSQANSGNSTAGYGQYYSEGPGVDPTANYSDGGFSGGGY